MAVLFIFSLKPPIESDVVLLSGSLKILTGPCPTKIAGHDLHKAAVWLHEVVIDEPCPMHANLEQQHRVKHEQSGQDLDAAAVWLS